MTFLTRMTRKSLHGLVKCVPIPIVEVEDAVEDAEVITMVHEMFVWRELVAVEVIEVGELNTVEPDIVRLELVMELVEVVMEDFHLVLLMMVRGEENLLLQISVQFP